MSNKKISVDKILAYLIEVNYLFLLFVIPLWFSYLFLTFHIFEFSKLNFFRFLLFLLILFTAGRFFLNKKLRKELLRLKNIKFGSLFKPPFLLILILLLLLPFSLNIGRSFYGAVERQQGIISYIFYFLLALTLVLNINVFTSPLERIKKIGRILQTIFFSSLIVAIYGILQIFNIDFLNWLEQPYLTQRAISTLGQPNFLASFLLLTIPLAAYLGKQAKPFLVKFFYYLALALQILALYFTASRGAFVAFVVTGLIFLFYLLLDKYWSKNRKKFITLIVISLCFFGIIFFSSPVFTKIKTKLDFRQGSVAMRVFLYQAAADAILEKPWFGYGAENGAEVFIKYYERDWGLHESVSANSDRAHNIFLDLLINYGFIGFFAFIFWYYHFFKLGFKVIAEDQTNDELKSQEAVTKLINFNKKDLSIALILSALAYLISLFFSFTIVSGELYFWTYFALLVSLVLIGHEVNQATKITANIESIGSNSKNRNQAVNHSSLGYNSLLKYIIFIIIALISVQQIYQAWQISQINHWELVIRKQIAHEDNIGVINTARLLNNYRVIFPQTESMVVNFIGPISAYCLNHINAEDDGSIVEIQSYLRENLFMLIDSNYKHILIKAQALECLGDMETASKYYYELIEIAPEWPQTYFNLAHFKLRRGEIDEAIKYFKLTHLTLPDESSPLINQEHKEQVSQFKFMIFNQLGSYFLDQGWTREARHYFNLAYRAKISNSTLLKKIADTYYLEGDFLSAIKYLQHGILLNPTDYQWPLALAILEAEQKNVGQSLASFYQAWELAPVEKREAVLQTKLNILEF